MNVAELIEKLQQLPQDAEVLVTTPETETQYADTRSIYNIYIEGSYVVLD